MRNLPASHCFARDRAVAHDRGRSLVTPARRAGAAAVQRRRTSIPFDAAVQRGTLPNGLKYFVRQNGRPAKRVLAAAGRQGRLAPREPTTSRGSRTSSSTWRSTAARTSSRASWSRISNRPARGSARTSTPTPSFDETVYMLELPTDKPEIVDEGLDGARRLRRRADARCRTRSTRNAASSSRSGAAASAPDRASATSSSRCSSISRATPSGCRSASPRSCATRRPARLRAFYDTWYRPDRMAVVAVGDIDPQQIEQAIRTAFGAARRRARRGRAEPDGTVPLHQELLVSVVDRSGGHAVVACQLVRKRPARAASRRVGDYRRDLVAAALRADVRTSGSASWRGSPTRSSSAPASAAAALSRDVDDLLAERARARTASSTTASASLAIEAQARPRVRLQRRPSSIARSSGWRPFYERAYNERDKTESGSLRAGVPQLLPRRASRRPGIEYEYRLVQQLLPGDHARGSDGAGADAARPTTAASCSRRRRRRPSVHGADRRRSCRRRWRRPTGAAVTPWSDTTTTRALMETKPDAGRRRLAPRSSPTSASPSCASPTASRRG